MALDANILSKLIGTKMAAAAASGPISDPTKIWDALAAAIVEHIKSNADVVPTGTVPMTVLVAGSPVPVLGTGKVQ